MAEKDLSTVPQVVSITNNNSGEITKEVTLPGGKGNVKVTEPYNDDFRFQFFKTNTWFDIKPGDTLKVLAQSSAELNNYLEQGEVEGISVTVEDVTPEPPEKSDVATLKSLTVSGGTLVPTFAADTDSYTATFASGTTDTTVAAEPTDSKATVDGTGSKTVTDGSSLTVKVTAEDGTSTKTYTINCVVEKSTVATLASLEFSSGTMEPEFSADTTSYTVTFPASTSSTDVTAEPTDSKASVEGTGTGKAVTDGGTLEVVVTAEDGTTKKTYTASCVVPSA